jgi:hypothetical protein
MYDGEKKANKKAVDILCEKGLQVDWAHILADELIPQIIKERRAAIASSAPSIDVGVAKTVESLVYDFELKIAELDAIDGLMPIIKRVELAVQRAKYDF